MPEKDANGNIVVDSNGDPMRVEAYYNVGAKKGQYAGQWAENKNFRQFYMRDKNSIVLKNINSNIQIVPVLSNSSDNTDVDIDSEEFGKRGNAAVSRYKRKTKKVLTKRGKSRRNKKSRKI
jgi:hypothetical protein